MFLAADITKHSKTLLIEKRNMYFHFMIFLSQKEPAPLFLTNCVTYEMQYLSLA